MNEVSVSVTCSSGGAGEGVGASHVRDPLAWSEVEGGADGEQDPLAVDAPLVKSEPPGEVFSEEEPPLVDAVDVKETEITKGEESSKTLKVTIGVKGNVNQTEEEDPIPKIQPSIDSKLSIVPSVPPQEVPKQNASLEGSENNAIAELTTEKTANASDVDESKTSQTSGTTNKDEEKSLGNGVEKKESYEKLNGDHEKELPSRKRSSGSTDSECPAKKLCQEVEKTFPLHDNMINNYIQTSTKNSVDEIQRHTDQLLSEIQTLRGLAQKKELEWNNILHLKKVKEEILLRLLRKKQVLSFEKSPQQINGTERASETDFQTQSKSFTIDKSDEISGVAIKQPGSPASAGATGGVSSVPHYSPLMGAPPPYDKQAALSLSQSLFQQPIVMPGPRMSSFGLDVNSQMLAGYNMQMGRQGPVKDVKSIIADYRQRHPENVPRRGRRIRSILNPQMGTNLRGVAPKMDSINNLGMILNTMDMANQKSMLERLSQVQGAGLPNGLSFKDVLVQFANLQQQSAAGPQPPRPQLESLLAGQARPRNEAITVTRTTLTDNRPQKEPSRAQSDAGRSLADTHKQSEQPSTSHRPPLLPPPYPEISLHPVVSSTNSGDQTSQSSSLLHGILTKQASSTTQTISPTLAKLLTSPESKQAAASLVQAKSCGEITITPVQSKLKEPGGGSGSTGEPTPQPFVQLEEESEGSGGEGGEGSSGEGGSRLVIDEGGVAGAGGDVPPCQGCRRRDAQFVCAGCANQWYCSRDCQVAAWDEHSEMCSG